jgi:apolipoprotein N-acyltransferase
MPSFVETAGDLPYSYRKDQTFYTRRGDWFGWSCVVVSVIAVVLARK